MIKYTLLLLMYALCNMHSLTQAEVGGSSVDSVFVQWNKATLKSLASQKGACADSSVIESLDNRTWGIPLYWDIASPDSINKRSLRYRFLEKLTSEDLPKEIYVVEANSNGAKIITRNFVVHKGEGGRFQAKLYMYLREEWEMRKIIELDTCLLSPNLKKNILRRGLGFNSDDIIISHFVGRVHKVVASEYYLGAMLSMDSGIKKLIDAGY